MIDQAKRSAGVAARCDFYFRGAVAGRFEEPELPLSPGCYRYMPYRSFAHLQMQEALNQEGTTRCSYRTDSGTVSFSVRKGSEHATLEVFDFESLAEG